MKALTDEFAFKTLLNLDTPTHLRNNELENEAKKFFSDSGLQDAVQKIRNLFHSKKEALIHGDLHTGSALVKNKDVRVRYPSLTGMEKCIDCNIYSLPIN